jgi:hypothetical protein
MVALFIEESNEKLANKQIEFDLENSFILHVFNTKLFVDKILMELLVKAKNKT